MFAGIGGFDLAFKNVFPDGEIIGYSEIDKYAISIYNFNFPNTKNYGSINNRAEDLPKFDIATFGFPCFPKGTMILTKEGNNRIENINKGDLIYTHKGKFKECVQTMNKQYNGLMWELNFHGGVPGINCTPEHPIYVSKKNKKWDNKKRGYEIFYSEHYFEKAANLTKDDYCLYPIKKGNQKADKNLMEFLGFYLAEGWYSKRKRKKKNGKQDYRIYLAINKKEKSYIQNLVKKLKVTSRYSTLKEYKIHFEGNIGNGLKCIILSEHLWNICKEFGDNAKRKKIPEYIFNIRKQDAKYFIKGYYNGDGYYNAKGFLSATTISKELAEGMQRLILQTHHKLASVHKYIRSKCHYIQGRKVNQNDTYTIRYYDRDRQKENFWFVKNGYLYIKPKKISTYGTRELVYNIGVRGHESYTVGLVAVHNCQDLSIAGKRKGFKGQRSSLFHQAMRIINECRPSYFIFENVKGLFSSAKGEDFITVLQTISDIGYDGQWYCYNSKAVIPQNRERIFFTGTQRKTQTGNITFRRR